MSKIMREMYASAIREQKRYSIDKDDPGFANYVDALASGKAVRVLLGGVPVKAITADEAQGFVILPAEPFWLLDGKLVTTEKRGRVVCELV